MRIAHSESRARVESELRTGSTAHVLGDSAENRDAKRKGEPEGGMVDEEAVEMAKLEDFAEGEEESGGCQINQRVQEGCAGAHADRPTAEMRADCEKLADIFTVLQRCFLMNLSKELARGKVSFPQYFLLGFLGQHKHLTMSEIAAKMRHTTAAATGLVDRLEKLDYVRRTHASDDRRKIEVQITPAGLALVAEIREDMVCNLAGMMKLLTPEEQRAWVQVYEKIFACIKR